MVAKLIPIPFNDKERIEALQALAILDTPRELAFDRLTRLAAAIMRAPISLVSLIDIDRQWFKSCHGLEMESSPRDLAFCTHAIMSDELFVVLDAAKDPRFSDNPFVTGEAHLRFYVGAPLVTRDKFRIGTLCVVDTEPRDEVTPEERQLLSDLANMVVEAIEGRHAVRDAGELLMKQLAKAAEMANAGETAKANLMAMLGHELRTPLNAIIGFSEVMTGQAFGPIGNPRYCEYAQHIRDSGQHLLGLIGTLLNLASCDRGEIVLQEADLNPRDVLADCVGMMSERARQSDVTLNLEEPGDLPVLKADREQLVQMLLNLIGNAIKFNHQGGQVAVSASLVEGQVVLSVRDNGKGMPADRLEQSRGTFEQLESGLARNYEGLGLGLALTDRLIELHGGRLDLDSELGEGTTAMLTFPKWRTLDRNAVAEPKASRGS
jgi:signal transduction histidine kinase